MSHDHNSPLLGAAIGAIAGVYKAVTTTLLIVTWDGIIETGVYALIGSAIGATISFWVTKGWKKVFKR